jgi:hypothetical protein
MNSFGRECGIAGANVCGGTDSAAKGMTCVQYDALIPSSALLEVVDSNASYVNGSAFNRLC